MISILGLSIAAVALVYAALPSAGAGVLGVLLAWVVAVLAGHPGLALWAAPVACAGVSVNVALWLVIGYDQVFPRWPQKAFLLAQCLGLAVLCWAMGWLGLHVAGQASPPASAHALALWAVIVQVLGLILAVCLGASATVHVLD